MSLFKISEIITLREVYDTAGIDKQLKPPQKLMQILINTQVVYSSGYKRSSHSLRILGFDNCGVSIKKDNLLP